MKDMKEGHLVKFPSHQEEECIQKLEEFRDVEEVADEDETTLKFVITPIQGDAPESIVGCVEEVYRFHDDESGVDDHYHIIDNHETLDQIERRFGRCCCCR